MFFTFKQTGSEAEICYQNTPIIKFMEKLSAMRPLTMLLGVLFVLSAVNVHAERNASVLICSTRGAWGAHVDVGWLKDIQATGLEPDYLDQYNDFTWERVKNYNCLVIYGCPAEDHTKAYGFPEQGPRLKEYVEIIERFLARGGVFVHW